MNFLNVNRQNDLITRSQTYVLDRKLVTVHSNDRDIKKWPHANNFEVEIPETIQNIQSLRVVQTSFPMKLYTFSNEYQNTKMSFKIIPEPREQVDDIVYIILSQSRNHSYTIEIQEGTFTPEEICREIERKMNREVYEYLISKNLTPAEAEYTYFTLTFDSVSQKIFFGNSFDNFTLQFNKRENFTLSSIEECKKKSDILNRQPDVWKQYTHWGLPYYIGFNKQEVSGIDITEPFVFDYRVDSIWLSADSSSPSGKAFYVEANNVQCLGGESVMYMMLDKFNSMDEIVPYSEATNNMYNNDYNGTVNAAFEKIPLSIPNRNETFNSRNDYLQNVSHYDTPIENIRKLKFQFRFHDGRLVDFQDCDFNFTISFNCIRDEIPHAYELRIPASYSL